MVYRRSKQLYKTRKPPKRRLSRKTTLLGKEESSGILVTVVLGLVWPIHRHTNIIGLLGRQLGQLGT